MNHLTGLEERFQRGCWCLNTGEYERAIHEFSYVVRHDPMFSSGFVGRAVAYLNLQHYNRALADCSRAIRLDPGSALAHYNRALTYIQLGAYSHAEIDAEAAHRLEPDDADYLALCGRVLGLRGQTGAAILRYTEAITLQPGAPTLYMGRAGLFAQLGDYMAACLDYDMAERLGGRTAELYLARGGICYALARYGDALKDATCSLELKPRAETYHLRGVTHLRLGDSRAAVADLSQAIRLAPQLSVSYVERARVYALLGEHEQAVADATTALTWLKGDPEVWLIRACSLLALDHEAAALADLTECLRLAPHHRLARWLRARLCAGRGDWPGLGADLAAFLTSADK